MTSFSSILGQSWKVKFHKVRLLKFKTLNFDLNFCWNWSFFHYEKIMRFKKSPQLPRAGRTRAGHHHGSHMPTSPGAILLNKMACQPKHIGRQCNTHSSLQLYSTQRKLLKSIYIMRLQMQLDIFFWEKRIYLKSWIPQSEQKNKLILNYIYILLNLENSTQHL